MIALAAVLGAQASKIYIDNFSINVGETKTVQVKLDNTTSNLWGMLFDVYINANAGTVLQFVSAPVKAGLTNRSDITFNTFQPESNLYRVYLSSSTNTSITGSGVIASFQVKCIGHTPNPAGMGIKNASIDEGGDPTYLNNTSTSVSIITTDAKITADNLKFTNGQTKKVQFSLNTSLPVCNLQADIIGHNLTPDFSSVTLVGSAANTHEITVSSIYGRVVIMSQSQALLPQNTPIFEMNFTANDYAEDFGYVIALDEVYLSDASLSGLYSLPDHFLTPVKQGYDVNGDGKINVSDVTALINKILGIISK